MSAEVDIMSENTTDIPNTPIKITGLINRVDENNIGIEFYVYNFLKGQMVRFTINRTDLTPKELKKNIERNGGICLDAKKLCEMVEVYINKLLIGQKVNENYIISEHEALGWKVRDNEVEFDAFSVFKEEGIRQSRYAGKFDIEPRGCLKNIQLMVSECIVGNIQMQAVMTLGAAATTLGFSNLIWETNIYNVIIHLMSNSSRGKTTAAKLVTSFVGNPEGANSCCLSYLATSNAILKRIGNAFGIPFAIDEFSTAKSKKEWSDFIYTLSNGYDKDRCEAGGAALQETARFQTVFVSNGENSILKKCNGNEGIRARLFELNLDSYTNSAEESDVIKKTVSSNYGILTPLIAQELMKNSDKWNERRKYWKEQAREETKAENIVLNTADRIMEYVGLFTMSCELLSTVLNVKLDVNAVFKFFFLHMIFKNAEDANIGIRVYDYVMGYIASNRQKFYELDAYFGIPTLDDEHIGYVKDCSGVKRKHKLQDVVYNRLYIFPEETIETLLKNKGYEDVKVAMRDLAKRKLLRTHGDRPTWEFPVNGIEARVYAFWAKDPIDFLSDIEKEFE